MIYNGSFFYNAKDTNTIVKYNLMNKTSKFLHLPVTYNNKTYLYKDGGSTVDLSVDDNGLWVIFAMPDSNNTAIMKVGEQKV